MDQTLPNICMKLKSSNIKLQSSFPNDAKFDFKISFKKKVYNVQKAFLRIES
jgi:hypothetical protein